MPTEVHTGGLKKFVYQKGQKPEKDFNLEKEIDEGYRRYNERKKRDNTIRILIFLLVILAIFGFLIYRFLF